MKTQTFLNYFLATVIVVLLFYIRTSAEFTESKSVMELLEPTDPGCKYNDIGGFAPAKEIDKESAREITETFKEFASIQKLNILGGVVSKAALDSLFCEGKYNGIAYQFAIDPKGKNAPANEIIVVLGAVNVDKDLNITSESRSYYISNLWCPPSCMAY